MKFSLEGAIGLYWTFGKEVLLRISPDSAVRFGVRNILSMHTGGQVGPNIRYKIPPLAVIAFEFVELNLKQINVNTFDSTNIKGSSNTGVSRNSFDKLQQRLLPGSDILMIAINSRQGEIRRTTYI